VGTTVTWGFGPVAHTVVFGDVAGHPPDISTATANQTVGRTFNTVGTFPYSCSIHPEMQGSISVTAAGASPPPPPGPPPPPPPPPPGYP
jgi:plastocyanin